MMPHWVFFLNHNDFKYKGSLLLTEISVFRKERIDNKNELR